MSKGVWIGAIVVIAIFGALMYFAMSGQAATSCDVCIEFKGQTQCRTAKGPNKIEAMKTAADNACALLASGMTESIACSHTDPKSVKCQ